MNLISLYYVLCLILFCFVVDLYIYIYSVFFFLHNCPLLIPLYNTAVLINICRFLINVVELCTPLSKLDLPNASQGQRRRMDATEQMKNLTLASFSLGSSPSECQIFHLFRCILSSVLPLRSVGKSSFDKGMHNLATLI